MTALALLTQNPAKIIGAALLAVLVSGCAQQQTAGYYDAVHDTTESDARQQAQGRSSARAPSQLQFGFGNTAANTQPTTAAEVASANAAIQARPLAEAKTFLGTVPCMAQDSACQASRLTLTLAPDRQWRARTVLLDAPASSEAIVQQGCWSVVGTQPLRIALRTSQGTSMANLSFVNDNVLRINRINDVTPTLDYHLTRQADIDPIDDLTAPASLDCNS